MVQAFEDIAPSGEEFTEYDRKDTMLYICLLERRERGRDWQETGRAFFGIDAGREPERARRLRWPFLEGNLSPQPPSVRADEADGPISLRLALRQGTRSAPSPQ